MKQLTKFFLTLHRLLGIVLCLFFLMWFLSGIVMLYHRFPRVYESDRVEHLEPLGGSDSLPALPTLLALAEGKKVSGMRMERYLGQTYFNIQTSDSTYVVNAHEGEALHSMVEPDFMQRVRDSWCQAPVARIDTLTKLDQWVPFGSMKAHLPIYRYTYDDEEEHQLYQSSTTGRVLNFTTHAERFWAWLGAIPHWIYFYQLRQYIDLWNDVVVYSSGIGCIMVIAGLFLGIQRWVQYRKRGNKGVTPYKKRLYRWHHIGGLIFGVFALTFVFSGMMSMMPLPSWITHSHLGSSPARYMTANAPQPSDYVLDYRKVVEAYPQALQITWSNFRHHPFFTVTTPDDVYYVDGNQAEVAGLDISRDEFLGTVQAFFQTDSTTMNSNIQLEANLIDRFETYYRERSVIDRDKLLPVWKIEANDRDHSVFYMNPRTGNVRYVDRSSRLNYWAYTALHRLRIGYLNSNTPLRKTIIWIMMLGGAVVSFTGVVMGVMRIRRWICK